MKSKLLLLSIYIFAAAFTWCIASTVVFRFRHPWATDIETLLNIHNAFTLKKVPYSELRPRE